MDITEFERRLFPDGTKKPGEWTLAELRAQRRRAVALQKELGASEYKRLNRELGQINRQETRVYGSLLLQALAANLSKRRHKNDE
jgi:hypothetical protein